MKNYLSIIAAIFFALTSIAQTKSPKRGICGDASPQDLAVLAPGNTWYYDWGVEPPAVSQNQLSGIEWVPMIWGRVSSSDITSLEARIPQGSKFLLGFNEPNFKSQANITPADAAAMWPIMEKIATDKGLKLVSPAVNWCGDCVTGVTYDPTDWLDKFFAACPTCHVDYIAVHNYSPSAEALKSYIEKFRKYNKPLWITEFAPWDPPKPDYEGVVKYMTNAIPILEAEPLVFRYSWFATRVGSNPDINLLDTNGKLSKLGQLYNAMAFTGLATDLPPVVIAGADVRTSDSATITLKATTYDANNDAITINWTQISGPSTAILSNTTILQPIVLGLVEGTYVFKIAITANGKTDSDEVSVYVGQPEIARNKPITASSVESATVPATNANDGNLSTRWSSAFTDPQWVRIDLQAMYKITGVQLFWESAASKIYKIEVSSDGLSWNSVYSTTIGDGGTDYILLNTTGRYVRMYSNARTTQWGNSLYEFEVYGSLAQTGIETTVPEKSISVFPNPAYTGKVTVLLNGKWSRETVQIMVANNSGQVVYSEKVPIEKETIELQINNVLTPGIYLLKVQGKTEKFQTKLVIQ